MVSLRLLQHLADVLAIRGARRDGETSDETADFRDTRWWIDATSRVSLLM